MALCSGQVIRLQLLTILPDCRSCLFENLCGWTFLDGFWKEGFHCFIICCTKMQVFLWAVILANDQLLMGLPTGTEFVGGNLS